MNDSYEGKSWWRVRSFTYATFTGRLFCRSSRVVTELSFGTEKRESPKDAILRRIAEGKADQGNVIIKSDELVCVRDIKPAADVHLLVLPVAPILSVLSFEGTRKDIELLKDMVEMGKKALREVNAPGPEESWWFGFHIPPMTSVDHLHMHCLAGNFSRKGLMKFKYNFNYYVHTNDVIERMETELT